VITTQPVTVIQCEGTNAVFTVVAGGTGLSYQWRKDGTSLSDGGDISGSETAILTISTIETADEGSYDVVITGTCSTVTSSLVQLSVDDNIAILVNPSDVTQCEGTLASFTVSASGTGPMSYQWKKNGTVLTDGGNILGSKSANLRVQNISTADEGTYTVDVTGKCNSVVSSGAVLTVDDRLRIVTQPQDVTQCEGTKAVFTVVATGTDLVYQWRKGAVSLTDGGDISGSGTATLTISNIKTADEGLYYVVITGKCNSEISTSVQLTVNDNVVITSQPADMTKCEGTTAIFAVGATGTGLTFRWYKDGAPLIDGLNIAGATTNVLSVNNISTADEGSYHAVITGTCSTQSTAPVTLSVDDKVVITSQPAAIVECENSNVSFSVSATGTGMTYRWRRNGTALSEGSGYSGTDTPVLTVSNINQSHSGIFDVVITGKCSTETSDPATLTVKYLPAIQTHPANVTECAGGEVSFTVNPGLTTLPQYQWQIDDNTGSGFINIPGATGQTLNLTGITYAMSGYRYRVIVSGDCPPPVISNPAILTVNMLPEITVQPQPVTVCSGDNAVFTVDAGATPVPVYSWYVNNGSGWNLVSGPRYSGSNTNTLTVVSVLESMSGYTYRVRISGTCPPPIESDPAVLTVTRQAEISQQPLSVTVCEGGSATFTVNAGLTTNPTYRWQQYDGSVWQDIAGQTNPSLVINPVTSAMNGNRYRAIVGSSCGSEVTSNIVDLIVNEAPEISIQPQPVTVCEGDPADFTVAAGNTTAPSYRWQVTTDNGMNWNNLTDGSVYSGTLTATLRINNPAGSMNTWKYRAVISGACTPPVTSDAAALTVSIKPVITVQPVNATICPNTGTTFSVVAQGTGLNYRWLYDKGDGMGYNPVNNDVVHSGADAATLILTSVPQSFDGYFYKVEITGTCPPAVTSVPVKLGVGIITSITGQPSDSTVCEFNPASFSVAAEGAGLTYRWQVNTGSGWNNITTGINYTGVTTNKLVIYNIPRTMDTYRFRVIVGSTCSGDLTSDEAVLRVNTSPKITVPPVEASSCPGETVSFSITAEGSVLTYQWQINTGSGFTDLTDAAPYSGVTTDKLTITGVISDMNGSLFRVVVSGACTPPATSPITLLRVNMLPQILTQPQDGEVCEGSMTSFMANILISGPETLQWQVKNSSGWTNITDNANYQGSKSLQLVIRNAPASFNGNLYRLAVIGPCDDVNTREALLAVHKPPVPDISPLDTILLCGGTQEQLNGNPAGGSGVYTIHRWLGDIGPLSRYDVVDPVFFAGMAGNYQLFYSVTDSKGCTGRDTVVVKVEKPTAMFTLTPSSGCQPLTVKPVNKSTDYQTFSWDFGDGATSTDLNPEHTYINTSPSLVYNDLKLTVESRNGCRDSMIIGVTVYPEIKSDFELSEDTICSGESVILSSQPGSFRYFWEYGDGIKRYGSNVVSYIYNNTTAGPVEYTVRLTATSYYNCTSITEHKIVVYPTPKAEFTAVPASQVWPSATVSITNNTNAGSWSWLWNLGDGSTSSVENPAHTYATTGEYVISLHVTNGQCSDSIKHNISILPVPPVANFDSIPSGCSPLNISLNNTSLNTELAGTTYKWDFGDGSISTAKNPTYTYFKPGIYRIELMVTGPGGPSMKSQVVHVYPSPKAYFEIAPPMVYVNDEKVRAFNLSQGAVSYLWDFGDGDTSHVQEPFHKYMEEGIYDITLWAYSANGCSDVYVLSPGVTVEPVGDLKFANVFRPNLDGPIERSDLPTGGTEIDQFFFPPVREKVLNYKLQIFNRLGVLIFESHSINVPWNGYYKGKLCPQGVYVWYVEGKFANGKPYKKVGDITLLH